MSTPEITLGTQASVVDGSLWKSISLAESLFLISVISMFLPVKIYPIIFLISSIVFYRETPQLRFTKWTWALLIFSIYAVVSFFIHTFHLDIARLNILKLVVNFTFLFFAINWLSTRNNDALIEMLDWVLLGVLILSLAQLLIYHQAYDFKLIAGSDTSGQASSLYNHSLYFWGLSDKNMFGARIALFGFAYICVPIVRKEQISFGRILFVFLIAFLSLSRTPIIALFLGVFFILWCAADKKWKYILIALLLISLPIILQKVIRVDSLTSSNDGMGIRLVYWEAFFKNFLTISPFGNGFLTSPEFLQENADFYRGEHHIHNTFLNTYLELGIIGILSFSAFIAWFLKECWQKIDNPTLWVALALPLKGIMMILYTGYDNDIIMYFCLIFLIGTYQSIKFKDLKFSV
ncbi:O-antigen ligase family protein [Algoriphagus chordae]|uniref:O-antigen ligase-like membrane protein n=1 Tax=Algoriphagus chordae TaxID=237019 RepID=A0A2W7REQ8_9BACT|nr:O-antigen ligase family protein [Algoriphagus chordae]PZX52699.1 O-antigen ligase-like membrane protein [Algoriphagus chordae]